MHGVVSLSISLACYGCRFKNTENTPDQSDIIIFCERHSIIVFIIRYQTFLFIYLYICTVAHHKGSDLAVLQFRTARILLHKNEVTIVVFRLHTVSVDREYKICLSYCSVRIRIQIDRRPVILKLSTNVKACSKPLVTAYQFDNFREAANGFCCLKRREQTVNCKLVRIRQSTVSLYHRLLLISIGILLIINTI